MATRISPKNKTYYINPAYLTFNENSGYGANLIQVSASSSCWISVYDPSNGIGYSDADRNYKRWKVTAYNNKFPEGSDNKLFHIYVRLEAEGTAALIVYDTHKRGVKGGLITETTDENGNKVEKEEEVDEENLTYYYIRIGQVSEVKGSLREITYDTGYLTSDEASNDKSGIDEMFELDKYSTPWLIKAKQWLQGWVPGSSKGFIVKGFAKLIGGLAFSKGKDGDEKLITDIKRSTDSDEEFLLDAEGNPQLDEQGNPMPDPAYVPVSDETIPTTKYVEGKLEGFDKKYIRKDQDDSTPYALTVGGKTTASGGIQIGKEFMSGLTGYGANINEEGRAELHSLFIRQFLEVPELRYNRVTVRMGDSITSCAAGVVESVNILSENEGTLKLKLEEGELGSLAVDDIVVQIFSDMKNPENNADETSDDGKGNRTMKGFATVMLRVIDVSGERNEIITYRLRKGYPHPYAMGPFAQRGNFTNSERQTIIYEGVYPKPYTRYMTGVNDWEFTFAMIGMQLGDLSNLSVFGQNLSGYSAYLNNIYYTGFIFELTPQQKAEISAYSVSLSEYVGSVRVDSEGNVIAGEYVPLNVVSGDENVATEGLNVVTGEVLLQTRVQAFKGEEELAYVSGIPEKGQFTSVISSSGCTAVISNGVVSITSVENFEYCSVKIETLCEGKTTFYNTYQVKVIKDGASALVIDLNNENDTIACKEDGSYLYGLPVSTHVIASYGEKLMDIKSIELMLPQDEYGNDLLTAVADAGTGKVEVVSVSDKAPDVMQIAIHVTVELFGKDETRSVVFTVGKLKQGESSEIYRLNPSVSVIKRFNDGQLSASVVSCSVTKYTGKSSEELATLPEGLTMSYKIDGVPAEYIYKEEIGIANSNKEVVFTLYVDGVKRDEETVLVVSDGNAVKEIKEWYLANDDKDTVPSYDDAWTLEIPSISKDTKYLWNYEETDYTDPSMEDVKTVPVVIAMWTQDGKGVKQVTEWYQVNNDKDSTPDYPHVDGDAWVSETAPVMTEDAKYLWNYEEILWTDDSVTYTEPAMIGAKGETGATTPVLSVSYKAVSRNSLGAFDPSTVVVSSKRGTEDNPVWMSAFGVYKEEGIEYHTFLGDSEGKVPVWNVELKKWSESVDELKITSIKFRSYSEQTNNYLQPWIAEDGLTFVQQGEVGEDGPMPRNRGQYDGEAEYFYNDEYRDYVWKPNGMVWIRQGRGVTKGTSTEGAVKGEEPSDTGNTEYWEVADRMALTAIDTALIDNANIAGFVYKDLLMVSQDFHHNTPDGKIDATIILDGKSGYFKCSDADVRGSLTAGSMSYKILTGGGDLTGYGMAAGEGEYYLPSIVYGEVLEIRALCTSIRRRAEFIFHSKDETPIYVKDDWGSSFVESTTVYLEPYILYTFTSTFDEGTSRMVWVLSKSMGDSNAIDGIDGSFVDTEMSETSINPVQNKVITSELKKYALLGGDNVFTKENNFTGGLKVNGQPIVYDDRGFWKLDGDLLVTGGVSMFSNDTAFNPYTITDAVRVDNNTIVKDERTGSLMINPDIELGGGLDEAALVDYLFQNQYAKKSDIDSRIDDIVDGAPAAYDTLKEIADVLDKNVDSVGDIITALGNKADKATTLAGYGITDAYTKSETDLKLNKYALLDGDNVFTKENNFTGGLKVNGQPIVYDDRGFWKLEGDLIVTGGVSMFSSDSSFAPSTITQAVNVDGTTIINDGTKLMLNPNIELGGGVTNWDDLEGTPNTLLGYGITDAKIANGVITLGSNTITPLTQVLGDARYVTALGTSGNDLTWTKNGVVNNLTVPYAKHSAHTSYLRNYLGDYNSITDLNEPSTFKTSQYRVVYDFYDGNTANRPVTSNNASGVLTLFKGIHRTGGGQYMSQMAFPDKDAVYFRRASDGVFGDWKQFAFTDSDITGNADTATALKNSRTLWGQSFDGKDNVSGDMTGVGSVAMDGQLSLNGITIKRSASGVLFIDGNLVVSGGVTMYGTDGTTSTTIWDNAPIANTQGKKGVASYDPNFFAVNNGVVTFVGQTGGGVADSVAWGNIDGKPSWITTSKPEYKYSEIKETPDLSGYAKKATTLSGYGITDATMNVSYDFRSGNLVTLDVKSSTNAMITVVIRGNSYTHSSAGGKCINTCVEFYNYNVDNLIYNANATHFGFDFGDISVFNYNGYICLWFAGSNTYRTYSVEAFYTNSGAIQSNKVKSITASAMPTSGVTRLVTITPIKGVDTGMYTASDVLAKLLTKDGTGSKLDADLLDGQEGSYYASAESLVNYLPLGGGTMTGVLTTVRNGGVYSDDGAVLISLVTDYSSWDGLRGLGKAGIAIANGSYPAVVRTSSDDLYHFRMDTYDLYKILDGKNYSGYMPFLNSASVHATNTSVIYAPYSSGTTNQVLVSGGANTAPSWVNQSSITSGACSGNATTATRLQTARKIWGQSFNGTKDVSGALSGVTSISMNGSINNAITVISEEDGSTIKGSGHRMYFGGAGYANQSYYFRPLYGSSGATTTALYLQNASASSSPTFTTTHALRSDGSASHTGNLSVGGSVTVNGGILTYNSTNKYWKLEGDLLVTGGVTMFGNDSSFSPSTITQAVNVDGTTIINDGKKLMLNPDIQLGGGGVTDYNDLTGKPDLSVYALKTSLSSYQTKITSTNKLSYSLIEGTPTSLKNPNTLSWNGYSSGSYDGSSKETISIPSNTNQLTNGAGFITSSGSITGNAATATTASKLSTVSKTAWGQTYWTSGGIPTNISGNMSSVGSITPSTHNTYSIGYYGNGFAWSNFNCISSGAVSNNLWLCGGTTSGIGVVIARSNSNTATGELCRFTEQGMVWASGVIPAIVSTAQEIQLKYNNADATSIVFNGASFKPFISSSDNIMLGRYDSLWRGLFLSTDASVPRTEKGVTFCSSNGYAEGKIGANSRGIGIYTVGGLYLRGGCTKGANGTMTESSTGAVIDASGNMLVTGGVTMYSDLRKKTILNYVELSLKEVADAPLIEHYYNSDESKRTHVGSVAQYWAGLNDWFCKEDGEGFLTMEIQNAALASAISVARELTRYESKTDKQIKKLKKRIGELEEEIENLKNK